MERFRRVLIVTLVLGGLEPLPCWGQLFPARPAGPEPRPRPVALGQPLSAPPGPTTGVTPPRPAPPSRPPQTPPMAPPAPLPVIDGKTSLLEPAPLQATDLPLPISLAAALKLADARPLIVAAAQASAWVAEAQLAHARVLWVPSLNLGAAYLRHDGFGPDTNRGQNPPFNPNSQKLPLNQNLNWLYAGGGLVQSTYGPAGLVADSGDAPLGFRSWSNMTADMIFEPLAVRQILNSRKWDIQSAKNDAILQTADAYFRVHETRGKYAAVLDVLAKGHKLVKTIEELSKELVPKAEVDRAKRLLNQLQEVGTGGAREAWRVSSADLTQVLRLDPRVVVVPLEHDHLQITLIDPARPLTDLIMIAEANRPEIASRKALIQAVEARVRREKWRPLLPNFYLNGFQSPGMRIQAGAFGTGYGSNLNLWSLRDDIFPSVSWQVEGFGAGNFAMVKEQRGIQSRMTIDLFRIQDAVAAEVTRSQAQLQSAVVRVGQAERALREATTTFNKNLEGLAQTSRFENVLVQIYRPQEVVRALETLLMAYNDYFTSVADYNRAQFSLFHALGYPAAELAHIQPPGNAAPVEVGRPEFLPPVGNGPPPATR